MIVVVVVVVVVGLVSGGAGSFLKSFFLFPIGAIVLVDTQIQIDISFFFFSC